MATNEKWFNARDHMGVCSLCSSVLELVNPEVLGIRGMLKLGKHCHRNDTNIMGWKKKEL